METEQTVEQNSMNTLLKREPGNLFLPFILSGVIIVLDQVTKALVVKYIPFRTIGVSYLEGTVRIIHTRNPAVAFSIGAGLPDNVRLVLFTVLPLLILGGMLFLYFRTEDFTMPQRWAVAAIFGGGTGNLIDRIFRPEGVVDFIDVKFYGLFGLERWPTFNVADSAVVVAGIVLIVSYLAEGVRGEQKG